MSNTDRKASSVTIEISGICNARCPYCAQWRLRREKHSGGYISASLFEQVLDHLLEIGIIDLDVNSCVSLFNWGEPSLNPELNDILRCIKARRMTALISSNFIRMPDIDTQYLSTVKGVIFSLSGFCQNSYSRIHGAALDKVIDNFDAFYKRLREHSRQTSISVSWHRYLFNEKELWDARKYFDRPGVTFSPVVAYFNDGCEFIEFTKGRLSEERMNCAKNDLQLDSIKNCLRHFSKTSVNYHCPAWDQLVIDETGQLLLCCSVTRFDADSVLGNVLDMSLEGIWKAKSNHRHRCVECIRSGLAPFAYKPHMSFDTPLPPGGQLSHVGLLSRYYHYYRDRARTVVYGLPAGENLISAFRRVRRKLYKLQNRIMGA
jgi:MoaA/NifB/PqqE/SkfB family radical SAM enzyme